MRCGALLTREIRGKKYRKLKITNIISRWWARIVRDYAEYGKGHLEIRPDVEVCDGEIQVSWSAVSEPEWGGSCTVFDIQYKCLKCGNTHFPELPHNKEEASAFAQAAIAALDEAKGSALVETCWQRTKALGEASSCRLPDCGDRQSMSVADYSELIS